MSSRKAAWLVFKRERVVQGQEEGQEHPVESLSEAERTELTELLKWDSDIRTSYELTQQFRQLVSERIKTSSELSQWLEKAKASQLGEIVSFARGIESDLAAVEGGLSSDYSNGQLEGQVNRLKNLKRQMYGRASFELLRKRVLAA